MTATTNIITIETNVATTLMCILLGGCIAAHESNPVVLSAESPKPEPVVSYAKAPEPVSETVVVFQPMPVETASSEREELPPPIPHVVKRISTHDYNVHKNKVNSLNDYFAQVMANEQLVFPGSNGTLRVWIGLKNNIRVENVGMVSAQTQLAEAQGAYAILEAFTSAGMDIVGDTKSKCSKIVPSGSEFIFALKPVNAGNFTVGARVWLFHTTDCSDSPIPKVPDEVKVQVTTKKITEIIHARANEATDKIVGSFFNNLEQYADKIFLLLFAVPLYLLRKKIFSRFGYKAEDQ